MGTKASPQQVQALIDEMCGHMRQQVSEEHEQSAYRIKGWFRTTFKVNLWTNVASSGIGVARMGYKGGKQAIGFGLDLTVKNVPGVAFVTALITALLKAVEQGVAITEKKLESYVVKKLADKGIKEGSRSKVVKLATHKYTADQGIKKIRNCLAKLKYGSGLMDKPVATCEDFLDRLHDLAWFEYRVDRLMEELAYLQGYAWMLEQDADEFKKAGEHYRRAILSRAERLLIEIPEDRHTNCGEICLLSAARTRFPQLNVPSRLVPPPPPPRHGRGGPVPKVPHGQGRPLPKVPQVPTRALPPKPRGH